MGVKKAGVFHSFLAEKMKERAEECVMLRREAKLLLGYYNVPRRCKVSFLKEMEEFNLIRKRGKRNIELL